MTCCSAIKKLLRLEREHNLGSTSPLHVAKVVLTRDPAWLRWRFVKFMRLQQYSGGALSLYYVFRKNLLGNKLGFEMASDNIGEGLYLIHNGPIVINSGAVLGKDVKLHGDNCIGNDGITDACPVVGNGVDVGVGAKVLGGVRSGRVRDRGGCRRRERRACRWQRPCWGFGEGHQDNSGRRALGWLSRSAETLLPPPLLGRRLAVSGPSKTCELRKA